VEGPHTQTKHVTLLHKILPIILVSSMVLSGSIMAFSQVATVKADNGPLGTLIIDGGVANPISLTVTDLQAMPQTTVYSDLLCGGLLVTTGDWQGVQLSYLLQQASADPHATSLDFHASDGYTVTLDLPQTSAPNVIIAYQLNDQSLSEVYRLVLPGQNGAQWISMITEITVSGSDTYHNYLNTTSPAPTSTPTNTTTPTPTPPSSPVVTPTPTQTAPPAVTSPPSASSEPTPNATGSSQPQISPEPTTPSTPTIPPTTPASPSAEPTQPKNDTGLGNQQGQPQSTPVSGTGLPVVPVVAGAAVALGLLAAGLLVVLRRHGFGR
jgi:hypothetical protein